MGKAFSHFEYWKNSSAKSTCVKQANQAFDDWEQPLRLRDAGFTHNTYWRLH